MLVPLLHRQCWLRHLWQVGHSQKRNEAESGSLALRLAHSHRRGSARRVTPNERPASYMCERFFHMAGSFHPARYNRLIWTHQSRRAREVSQSLAEWASLDGRLRLSSSGSAQKLLNTSVTFAAERIRPRAASRFHFHDHSQALSLAVRSQRNWPAVLDPPGFASLRVLWAFALNSDFSRSHEREKWRNPRLAVRDVEDVGTLEVLRV